VDSLNDLYGFLTTGQQDIFVDEVYGRTGHFRERIDCEGRPVILDGDPISVYMFYDLAKAQITEAIDLARITASGDLIAQYTGASRDLLERLYGKLPSKEDVTAAVDAAKLTATGDLIAGYARRGAEAAEAQLPRLDLLAEYARGSRDVLVKVRMDEYGNVGVVISEPLDEYGRVRAAAPSELLDEFRPASARASVAAADNAYGLEVALYKGGRPNVSLYYSLGGAGTVYLEASLDGATWRPVRSFTLSAAGEGFASTPTELPAIAFPYVRARTPATGIDVSFELAASR
jgi:hypothetical protein